MSTVYSGIRTVKFPRHHNILCKITLDVPSEKLLLLLLETFELFDQMDFEFRADSHTEFKGDVLVCIGAAITPGARHKSNRICFFNPFLYAKPVTVQAHLTSNYGEFSIIKIRIVYLLPNTKELDRVPVAQPVRNEEIAVLHFQHICQKICPYRPIVVTKISAPLTMSLLFIDTPL